MRRQAFQVCCTMSITSALRVIQTIRCRSSFAACFRFAKYNLSASAEWARLTDILPQNRVFAIFAPRTAVVSMRVCQGL